MAKLKFPVFILMPLLVSVVPACSKSPETEEPASAIPQHQLKTLDAARQTEALLLQADKDRREQINSMSK